MNRTPLIVGNWKMFHTVAQTRAFCKTLRVIERPQDVQAVICPPYTSLAAAAEELAGTSVSVGAQNMHAGDEGAFTGEVSAPMLVEFGVRYVLLGHSERRRDAAENDEAINGKIPAALNAGITPIVIVGESLEQHEAGQTIDVVVRQLRTAFLDIKAADAQRCVVAYEPIWAIGSGLTDEPASSNRVMGELRVAVKGLEDVQILYGGSMKPANALAFMEQPNIDGGLVGGASLQPASFVALLEAAAATIPA
jgi:triosephosphate isomerase